VYSNDDLAAYFVNSEYFLPNNPNMTGKQLQSNTTFGKMLSVTIWPTDNPGHHFPGAATMSPGVHTKSIENMSKKFQDFYECFQGLLKKLLKNKDVKDRVLDWFRKLVNLNTDYFKMMPNTMILSSKGLLLNSLAVLLEMCAPFTMKTSKYYDMFDKINPLYAATNEFLKLDSVEKFNSHQIEEVKVDTDEGFNFVTEWFFITHVGKLHGITI